MTIAPEGVPVAYAEPVLFAGAVVAVVSAWFPDSPAANDLRRLVELAAIGLASWWGRQEQQRDYELAWAVDAGRALERERRRLAYDLHGSVAQELAAARVTAESSPSSDPAAVQRALDAVRTHVQTAQAQTQRLIDALRARAPEDQGLTELVEAICREYDGKLSLQRDTVIALVLSDVPSATSSVLNESVAFVLREALQNVYEHAEARAVEVAVAIGKGCLTLTVSDDGVGFREGWSEDGRVHLGVSGIRERVRAVGGSVLFESRESVGTRMTVTIPI